MEGQSHCSCLCRESGLLFSTKTLWPVLYTILVLSSLFATGISQGAADFISIDCGGTGFVERDTHIEWSSDEGFLQLGNELVENHIAVPATVTSKGTKDNAEQQRTAMIFIPGASSPSKYCYVANVQNDTNYLVRAMFPSRRFELTGANRNVSLAEYSHQFYFIVDSTVIANLELEETERTVELVVSPLDEKMYICVVPLEVELSIAAISSIELRSLPVTLYKMGRTGTANIASTRSGLPTTYLMTVSRLNFGGDTMSPAIRYPIDVYDRLWYAAGANDTTDESQFRPRKTTNASFLFQDSTQNFACPQEVLKTAWEGVKRSSNISFTFNIEAARSLRSISTFYLSMFFHDVNPSRRNTSDPRIVDIYLEDDGPVTLWASADTEVTADTTTWWYNTGQEFSSQPREREPIFWIVPNLTSSVLPAMVNAFELLGQFQAETQRTAEVDDSTIRKFIAESMEIVSTIKFVDTAGDPCLPVPWSWILCSIESPPRITQINLTSMGATGSLPADFGNLSRLTSLDLSNNGFRGNLSSSLAKMKSLRELNLANNNLTGDFPWVEESSLVNLGTLTLRHNNFTGNLSSIFNDLGPNSSLSKIDLGFNSFNGPLPQSLAHMETLEVIDLSWNSLTGNVSVIGELLESSSNLQILSLQGNKFTGMVPSEIWSSKSKLQTVKMNSNGFQELDLTNWCVSISVKKDINAFKQKVDLNDNKIQKVILPASCYGDLGRPPKNGSWYNESNGFILLGGNPFCRDIDNQNPNLVLRYLCRSKEIDDFWADSNRNMKVVIAVSVISGFLVLLMACILLLVLRRMWKRMKELRQIQEALAKEDVRPPFFKYEDLKTATREFAEENELGKGAFGAVYKAVLADKSVVAVKLLYPTDQNIADFLKEMVLITGIKHKHLIQLKGCCVRDRKRLLIYEFAENKNLADALWGETMTVKLDWAQRLKICTGIARGLCYLHEELQPRIIHRDIKAQNILLDKHWDAKIADFGLALPVQEKSGSSSTQVATRIGGTLGYFSPEYATHGKLTEKLDVYSFGILVLEIISGRHCIDLSLAGAAPDQIYLKDWAFQLYSEGKIMDLVEKEVLATGSRAEILSVLKTALSCLHENHEKRPCMSQVVNMLSGKSPDEVAVDILGQLKDQERMYEGLFDASSIKRGKDVSDQERLREEHRALLQSALLQSTSSNDPQRLIELTVTQPR